MKVARALAALLAVQLILVSVYLAVEALPSKPPPFAVETLDASAPELELHRDAEAVDLPAQPHLVHFWATWCEPCQRELPGLLDAASAQGVPVMAITDEPWPVVERYFEHQVPVGIVRDVTGRAAATWGVSGLPDTFVVRDGRVVGRMGGPRDWQTPEAKDYLRALRGTR